MSTDACTRPSIKSRPRWVHVCWISVLLFAVATPDGIGARKVVPALHGALLVFSESGRN
jgi:hypothetical protein